MTVEGLSPSLIGGPKPGGSERTKTNHVRDFFDAAAACGWTMTNPGAWRAKVSGFVDRARRVGKDDALIAAAIRKGVEKRAGWFDEYLDDLERPDLFDAAWIEVTRTVAAGKGRQSLSPRSQQAWLQTFGAVDGRYVDLTPSAKYRFQQAWRQG